MWSYNVTRMGPNRCLYCVTAILRADHVTVVHTTWKIRPYDFRHAYTCDIL